MELSKRIHPHDPRDEDLTEDSDLWVELLNRFWKLNKTVYSIFHGLRCGGSHLKLINSDLEFSFGEDFTDKLKHIKKEYLDPHQDMIKIVMKKLGKDLSGEKANTWEECPF